MRLLQLSCPRIKVLPLVILHDYTKGRVARMVIDAPSAAGEDIVFVELGYGSAVVCLDCHAGWGDGSSFGSRHFVVVDRN